MEDVIWVRKKLYCDWRPKFEKNNELISGIILFDVGRSVDIGWPSDVPSSLSVEYSLKRFFLYQR